MRFTRVELVVVVIIGVAGLSLLIPFVLYQRSSSRQLTCQDRLQRLARAAEEHDATDGRLPGYQDLVGSDRITGWPTRLLPYLTTADPAGRDHLQQAYAALVEDEHGPTRIPEFLCPATRQYEHEAPLSYIANCGAIDADENLELPPDWPANGLFFRRAVPEPRRVTMSLEWLSEHDGRQVTLLLSENTDALSWRDSTEAGVGFVWVANVDAEGNPTPLPTVWPINQHRGEGNGSIQFARPASEHPGVVNAIMASGEAQAVSENIDYLVFQRLMTADGSQVKRPNHAEPLPAPWRHKSH